MKYPVTMVLALSVFAACGGDASTSGSASQKDLRAKLWRSGARLKVRTVGNDDAQAFVGFYDTKLEMPCVFAQASDGRMRCLPIAQTVSVAYADSMCSVPAALLPQGCAASAGYVGVRSEQSVCGPETTRAYDAHVASEKPALYDHALDEKCAALDPEALQEKFLTLGKELPPAMFIAAEVQTFENEAGTNQTFLLAEDGAAQQLGLQRTDGTECWVTDFPKHGLGCSPVGEVFIGSAPVAYRSESCTGQPLAIVFNPSCKGDAPAVYVYEESHVGTLQVLQTAKRAEGPVFEKNSGTCKAAPAADDAIAYYEFAQHAEPLPTLHEQHVGAGRLRRSFTMDEHGTVLEQRQEPFFDTMLASACVPAVTSASDMRCIPEGAATQNRFADADCKEPLGVAEEPSVKPHWWIDTAATSCGVPPIRDAREFGERYTGTSYELQSDDACTKSEPSELELYRLGPSRFNDLVRVAEQHE